MFKSMDGVKCYYGSFDLNNVCPSLGKDVTDDVMGNYLFQSRIVIPANIYNDGDKNLVVFQNDECKHIVSRQRTYPVVLDVLKEKQDKNIHIVYFCFVNPDKPFVQLICQDLMDLQHSGLLKEANLHIEMYDPNDKSEQLIAEIKKNITTNISSINAHRENKWEYYGIAKLYQVAKENPDDISLYYHSKNMSHPGYIQRAREFNKLYKRTIYDWNYVLDLFATRPEINKVGLYPSTAGWVWFNFWWVRNSYVVEECPEPIVNMQHRHYYESYIGGKGAIHQNIVFRDAYSLISNSIRQYLPHEAVADLWR